MSELLPGYNPEEQRKGSDFFEAHIRDYFNEQYSIGNEEEHKMVLERCMDWTMPNYRWRMFYVVLELLKPAHLSINIGDAANKQTVFDLVT